MMTLRATLIVSAAIAALFAVGTVCAQSDSIRFSSGQTLSGVSSTWAIASADFDGNNLPDLVACHVNDGYFYLLSNTGQAQFDSAVQIECSGGKIYWLAPADLDGNGSIDLAVACYDDIWIFTNDGAGVLTQSASVPFGTHDARATAPYQTIALDVNKDSRPDLLTAVFNSGRLSVLLNKGGAEFDTAYQYDVGINPHTLCAADFDKDSNIDVAIPCLNSHAVYILRGVGDGTFHAATTFATGSVPVAIGSADFDGDTYIDIAVARLGTPGRVEIYRNNGSGAFTMINDYAVDMQPRSLLAEDYDGDDTIDLAVGCLDNGILCVLKGKGDGSFGEAAKYQTGGGTVGICSGDFDDDGYADLSAAAWFGDVAVFLNESGQPLDVDDPFGLDPLPSGFALRQNYPNPFNPSTQIEFEMPRASFVQIHIYNTLGQQLRTLVSERLSAGRKVVTWDGTDNRALPVASGVYFYRISADGYAEARKMILLK